MIYLILSILCATSIYVVFKFIDHYKLNLLPVIVVNYATCSLTGLLLLLSQKDASILTYASIKPWFIWALLLGVVFNLIFQAMGKTTAYWGVTVTAIASKMAMIIPAVFFLLYDNKKPTVFFISAIIIGIAAIFLMTFAKPTITLLNKNKAVWLLPIIVWIGSGFIDISLKLLELKTNTLHYSQLWISTFIFVGAFVTGLLLLGIKKEYLLLKNSKNLIAGILLGIPNFGSIAFLLKAFSAFEKQTEMLFPINHIGIVVVSALVSSLIFKESFSKTKLLGLALAIISLLILNVQYEP